MGRRKHRFTPGPRDSAGESTEIDRLRSRMGKVGPVTRNVLTGTHWTIHMTISDICIKRPVFTWVLVAIPVVLGLVRTASWVSTSSRTLTSRSAP